jgi:hypothetical protein
MTALVIRDIFGSQNGDREYCWLLKHEEFRRLPVGIFVLIYDQVPGLERDLKVYRF